LISVNFTLLVQLANFLILLVILNFLLFKPVLRILDERERVVKESTELKEKFGQLAQESIGEYEGRILAAKQEAMEIRASGRSKAMSAFRKMVQEAKQKGAEDLDAARKKIAAQADSNRKNLMVEAEALAGDIAATMMGRKL